MDICVRSQHGSILTKVDGIYIQERGMNGSYMFDLIGIQRGGSTIRLGKYQYKSNAYNALKEFENWVINTNNIFLGHMSSSERTIINSYSIFQIPEDKDV